MKPNADVDADDLLQPDEPEEKLKLDLGRLSGTVTSVMHNIRTLEDLLAFAKVDTAVWEVERHTINKWEVGAKDKEKRVRVTPLYQIKVWLRKKKGDARDVVQAMISEFAKKSPRLKRQVRVERSGNIMESSICDIHHGKLAWGKETGEDYDLRISPRLQEEAMAAQLDMCRQFHPEKILIVVGNDYYHTDNTESTTTHGTRQDCDGRWKKQFTIGVKSMVESILMATKVAPVHVIVVPGNHDELTSFCLGEVLAARFYNTRSVIVDNTPPKRKYFAWGKCLLGLTHGNEEKRQSLPLLMASEVPKLWAASRFREIHVGHFHTKREDIFRTTEDFNGARYRVLPSLTPPDAWHKGKGFSSLRAADAFILNRAHGFIANISWSPT